MAEVLARSVQSMSNFYIRSWGAGVAERFVAPRRGNIMRTRHISSSAKRTALFLAATAGCLWASAPAAHGATWTFNGGGNWGDGINWDTNPTFPNAPGAVADFSKLDLTSDYTVNLGGART